MSESYSDADLSIAFNQGHNDAWNRLPPRQPPPGKITDEQHQAYRRGHVAGITARYWYDAGYAEAQKDMS